jgi:hypothetical protein
LRRSRTPSMLKKSSSIKLQKRCRYPRKSNNHLKMRRSLCKKMKSLLFKKRNNNPPWWRKKKLSSMTIRKRMLITTIKKKRNNNTCHRKKISLSKWTTKMGRRVTNLITTKKTTWLGSIMMKSVRTLKLSTKKRINLRRWKMCLNICFKMTNKNRKRCCQRKNSRKQLFKKRLKKCLMVILMRSNNRMKSTFSSSKMS